jgi:DNA-binding PadR family transcriptional regulator
MNAIKSELWILLIVATKERPIEMPKILEQMKTEYGIHTTASHAFKTVHRMVKDGEVKRLDPETGDSRKRHVFEITRKGKERLRKTIHVMNRFSQIAEMEAGVIDD